MKKITVLLVMICVIWGCSADNKKGTEQEIQKVYVGLFREGAPQSLYKIKKFEKEYSFKPHVIMWYLDWNQPFPQKQCKQILDYGAVPHIVWEPWIWGESDAIKLQNIMDGEWDTHIKTWAEAVKDYQYPIFLRFAHEFNIEGYPWGIVNNNKDYGLYIKVFRKVVDMFNEMGANNVLWVWNPMNFSYPEEEWNDYLKAYPGDDYVDWVGIDGYNWGKVQTWSNWETFEQVFQEPLRILSKNYPTKPIMIAEFASAELGGDKGIWTQDIPAYLRSTLGNLRLIHWFDLKKEANWPVDSSPAAHEGFKSIIKDPIFQADISLLNDLKVNNMVFLEKKTKSIAVAKKPPIIDAKLNEWKLKKSAAVLSQESNISVGAPKWTSSQDLSAKVDFTYDQKNLYIACEITDDMPMKNDNKDYDIWNGDCVEIAISLDPTSDVERTTYTPLDFQIGLSPGNGNNIKPSIWLWSKKRSPKKSKIASKKTENGYILEASIPWKAFKSKAPASGTKVGFTFAVDDADESGNRETQMIFSGNSQFYKDPSCWGYAIFN